MELIPFKADPEKEGDLGNYWHYTLGYFIPVTSYLLKNQDSLQKKQLALDSCNILLDKHLEDFLIFHGFSYSIKDFSDKSIKTALKAYKSIPKKFWREFMRWENRFRGKSASIFIFHSYKKSGKSILVPRWDEYLRLYFDLPPNFKSELNAYRDKMRHFGQRNSCCDPNSGKGKLLILSRAPKPTSISSEILEKNRWFASYGSERRELKHVKEGIDDLNQEGYNCLKYESGTHNLQCQINHFSNCSGVIGVRGAEFANMIWMKEKAIVILFHSADFKNDPLQRQLVSPLNLNYFEIPHNGQVSPIFDTKAIIPILKTHE